MKLKQLTNYLNHHLKKNKFVRLTTKQDGIKEIHRGYLHHVSREIVVYEEIAECVPMQLTAIPRSKITKARYNKFDRYFDRVTKLYGYDHRRRWNKADTFQSLFQQLLDVDEWVIIETSTGDRTFHIGQLEKVGKRKVSLRYFDATGCFDKKATKIEYDTITKVVWESTYIAAFRQYMSEER